MQESWQICFTGIYRSITIFNNYRFRTLVLLDILTQFSPYMGFTFSIVSMRMWQLDFGIIILHFFDRLSKASSDANLYTENSFSLYKWIKRIYAFLDESSISVIWTCVDPPVRKAMVIHTHKKLHTHVDRHTWDKYTYLKCWNYKFYL